MLRQAFVLLAMASVAMAAVAIQALEEKPEEYKDCDGCWVSAIQQFVPIGKSAPGRGKCTEYRCTDTYVEIVSCGVVRVEPPCSVTRDFSLPYPKCCATIVCPVKVKE